MVDRAAANQEKLRQCSTRGIKELTRLELSQAITTLGVDLAPKGNLTQQASKLKKASRIWANQLHNGNISG
jgi:hypothetical protein